MGFGAGIGSTYNFMPEQFLKMLNACRANDFHTAQDIQSRVNVVIDYFCQFENWTYRKAFMKYIGLDCGHSRLPFGPISDADYTDFETGLDKIGILKRNAAAHTADQPGPGGTSP
jgi:N-acetylneuraminate lyase